MPVEGELLHRLAEQAAHGTAEPGGFETAGFEAVVLEKAGFGAVGGRGSGAGG
ncbi:hypothetical protein SHIRM173S_05794 [Streptomyces hirsutus]